MLRNKALRAELKTLKAKLKRKIVVNKRGTTLALIYPSRSRYLYCHCHRYLGPPHNTPNFIIPGPVYRRRRRGKTIYTRDVQNGCSR